MTTFAARFNHIGSDGAPVTAGDKIQFNDRGRYTDGGSFRKKGIGVVKAIENGFMTVEVEKWIEHYDCSQRFGNSPAYSTTTFNYKFDLDTRSCQWPVRVLN